MTMERDEIAPTAGRGDAKNHIPVIDRMLDMLEFVEMRQSGITIKELCEQLSVPRSTVYRILHTLEARQMVRRLANGAYVLGPRLLRFASKVVDTRGPELAQVAEPYLERLALATGESVKLSVIYDDLALVVGCAQGPNEFALTVRAGRTVPLYAGATSKVLLANASEVERERIVNGPLKAFTSETLADPQALREELEKVRRQGWSVDQGEHSEGVFAVAAPVTSPDGMVVAAISIPYIRAADRHRDTLLDHVVATARDLSAALAAR